MVDGQIQNDLHISAVAQFDQFLQIGFCTKAPVDLIVIAGIVFVVRGGGENGRQPDALDTQAGFGVHISIV